jgi:hypothetical protein
VEPVIGESWSFSRDLLALDSDWQRTKGGSGKAWHFLLRRGTWVLHLLLLGRGYWVL